jgi:hypothetical protein
MSVNGAAREEVDIEDGVMVPEKDPQTAIFEEDEGHMEKGNAKSEFMEEMATGARDVVYTARNPGHGMREAPEFRVSEGVNAALRPRVPR